jgi:hypothetical protein
VTATHGRTRPVIRILADDYTLHAAKRCVRPVVDVLGCKNMSCGHAQSGRVMELTGWEDLALLARNIVRRHALVSQEALKVQKVRLSMTGVNGCACQRKAEGTNLISSWRTFSLRRSSVKEIGASRAPQTHQLRLIVSHSSFRSSFCSSERDWRYPESEKGMELSVIAPALGLATAVEVVAALDAAALDELVATVFGFLDAPPENMS